jgi:hexosaminidase
MICRMIFPVIGLMIITGCQSNKEPVELSKSALIPKPVLVKSGSGSFEIKKNTTIYINSGSEELKKIGEYLSGKTGLELKISGENENLLPESHIYLEVKGNDKELGEEGYELNIDQTGITLTANNPAGVFRGVQTVFQLLPDAVEGKKNAEGFRIAAGTIRDYPSYPFRGSMLDVSRHFFGVDDVKRYIDLIAFYKLNILHLHLSDDQGWRIEIKSWPNLTSHGGSTEVGGRKGGFYTQEQYKDLVNYAQERYVTIVPEIDLPGHTNAALASYPELNCNDTAPALYTKTEVGFSTLCVKKDITYKFIDDVVRELAALTPGPYIHLGGDESHATKKEDFIFFINKIQGIPKKYGKKMIGWEEIAQANLDSSTIVQFWQNAEYAKEAVKKGAKVIMSPATKVYLDMKYDSTTKLGQDWAARIEIDSSYLWSPSRFVNGIPHESILGIEAPLWTETITSMNEIEYMVFPRLAGIAEIAWSPEEGRTWDEYKARLARHASRMKAMDIDFYESKQVTWEGEKK